MKSCPCCSRLNEDYVCFCIFCGQNYSEPCVNRRYFNTSVLPNVASQEINRECPKCTHSYPGGMLVCPKCGSFE